MKKSLFTFALFAIIGLSTVDAQCVNANFSTSNLTNWTGSSGNNNTGVYDSTYGMVVRAPNSPLNYSGEQTIMNLPRTDPNTTNLLSVLPPIETTSCRLGNQNAQMCDSLNLGAARLSYKTLIDSSNFIFTYQYAVVLQNTTTSGHTPAESPKFVIRELDSTGAVINSITIGDPSLSGLANCSPSPSVCDTALHVSWKNWTIDYFDLSSYIGHNVTIDFTAYDCSLGGHFGYAYISCYCGSTITIGINEMELSNKIKIYPNPATDNLNIKIEDFRFENLDLKINDIVGNTVLEKTLYNKLSTIDVSALAKGMYFVNVKTAKGVESL